MNALRFLAETRFHIVYRKHFGFLLEEVTK